MYGRTEAFLRDYYLLFTVQHMVNSVLPMAQRSRWQSGHFAERTCRRIAPMQIQRNLCKRRLFRDCDGWIVCIFIALFLTHFLPAPSHTVSIASASIKCCIFRRNFQWNITNIHGVWTSLPRPFHLCLLAIGTNSCRTRALHSVVFSRLFFLGKLVSIYGAKWTQDTHCMWRRLQNFCATLCVCVCRQCAFVSSSVAADICSMKLLINLYTKKDTRTKKGWNCERKMAQSFEYFDWIRITTKIFVRFCCIT